MTRRWILGTLWIGLLVLPAPTLAAQDSREERIRDLEARLSRLEQKLGSPAQPSSGAARDSPARAD